MGIFAKTKENEYVKNMETVTRVNLSLLETMAMMQKEYETIFNEKEALVAEIKKMKEQRRM